MNVREVSAYVHRNRIANVVNTLYGLTAETMTARAVLVTARYLSAKGKNNDSK